MAKRIKKSKNTVRSLNGAQEFQNRGIKDKLRQMAPFMLHPRDRGDQQEDKCQEGNSS